MLEDASFHYTDYGYKDENKSVKVPEKDKIWQCGDSPDDSCKCMGTVHYGFLESPIKNSPIKSFD